MIGPMTNQAKVCMVGSAMTDLVARVPRLPQAGETLIGSSFMLGFGGKGSNQAVMAARLGAEVSVVARLGRDTFGDSYLKNYQEQGINTDFVRLDDMAASGIAMISVDEVTAENSIVIVPGANDRLSARDVERAAPAIQSAQVLICQLETPIGASLAAFGIAREAGVLTVLNPAPARDLPAELLGLTDIFVPNEVEAAMIANRPITSVADAQVVAGEFLNLGPRQVVITMGARGVVMQERAGAAIHLPAPQVQAVDTTGAGDAFVGSLATFLALDFSLETAVERSVQIASLSVQKAGTQTSFPYAKEVAAWLH